MLQCRYQQSSRRPCVASNCRNHSRCIRQVTAVDIACSIAIVKKVVEFRRSSYRLVHLQTDADFPRVTVGKNNTGLLKGFLYLENRRKVSFYDSIILLDALKCRQANPRRSGELSLAPAQKRPPSSDLRRISHPFGVFAILYRLQSNNELFYPIKVEFLRNAILDRGGRHEIGHVDKIERGSPRLHRRLGRPDHHGRRRSRPAPPVAGKARRGRARGPHRTT